LLTLPFKKQFLQIIAGHVVQALLGTLLVFIDRLQMWQQLRVPPVKAGFVFTFGPGTTLATLGLIGD
jgi:hypothetical protein